MMHLSLVAWLILTVDAAWAQDEVPEGEPTEQSESEEEESGPDPEEVLAFKGTVNRFVDRMEEFNSEARNIIQRREKDERDALIDGYRGPLAELRSEEVALRDTAIGRLEDFLVRYPASSHSAHAMFLLGDLYYEESEEAFTSASQDFEKLFAEGMDLANMPEAPVRDHGRALRMFGSIVDGFPAYTNTDGALYMLGFIFQRDETLQSDDFKGRDAYLALVDQYPESEFAAASHMALGEHFFDNHQIDAAIRHYEKVVKLHAPDGQHYEKGLYKLAWSYYKLSSYDMALDLLAKLLDWSEENFLRTGKRSAMAPEAVEYTAISFSDISDRTGIDPVDVAQRFYRKIGERDYESKVFERLADVLTQQARYLPAIQAYKTMIQRWPNAPENPTHMWTIAKLYRSLDVPDQESAQNTITQLNELFNRDSSWAHANRNNPDALAVADGYIEESLAMVAIDLHNAASEANDVAKFNRAADLYSQYLNKFPFAKDYYEIQWYFADTLRKSRRLPEAAAEYVQLLKGKGHPYADGSMWNLMQVRRQVLIDRYGKVESLPPDAVEESRVTLVSGAERVVYQLSDAHKDFIESADMLSQAKFENEEYAESLEQFRPAMAYLPGQILYFHGHLEGARERLLDVIETWPGRDEAAFAASLVVDSWQDEEDLAKVRMWAGKFARMSLGSSDAAMAKNMDFTNLEEGAAFKMAAQYIEQGKREEAAEAFLSFMNDFPRSEHIKKAHYNAANNFEIIGQVERANSLFRDYIENIEKGKYEADDQAWPIYERIAFNYASSLELNDAVRYFEMLYRRSAKAEKPYENAPAALYNAGFLRIGLGDHRGAAENLERYATQNRDQLDAEAAMWTAADQWELLGRDEAKMFYERYLAEWGTTNPDHAIAARYELAKYAEEVGDRYTDQAWLSVIETYNELAPGGQLGPLGIHYAAAASFRPIQKAFDEFSQYAFTDNDEYNAKLITEIKASELAALEKQCVDLIKAYPDFDYSSAALYTLGASFLTYAKLLFEAPEPTGLDDEQLDMYFEILDEKRIPVEDKGKARLGAVLEKAKKEKRWSEWTTKTVDFLATAFPSDYSRETNELRGSGDLTLVPMAGPMSPIGAEEVGAEEVGGEETEATPATTPEQPTDTPDTESDVQPGVWQ